MVQIVFLVRWSVKLAILQRRNLTNNLTIRVFIDYRHRISPMR